MSLRSIPILVAAASLASAPLAFAQQCPPNSEQVTVVVSDTFGPFSGIFDTALAVPQWNPGDFRPKAQLVQVQVEISSSISSSAFVSNGGDSACSGGWSASNDVDFMGNAGLGVPAANFFVLRAETFNLLPGDSELFPVATVMESPAPVVISGPENLAPFIGRGSLTFPIQGLTSTTCDSNCGVVMCNIDLSAEVRVDVTYTYCVQGNEPPICDTGPLVQNYPCQGEVTAIQLDASASTDPDGDDLFFNWNVQCDNAVLDDPSSPTPTLFFSTMGACNASCVVFVRVSDGQDTTFCIVRLFVYDALAPQLDCEDEVTAECGASDPGSVGFPLVTDACDPDPMLVNDDVVVSTPTCPAARNFQVLERTWTATDTCGNIAMCTQTVLVEKPVASLDVIPGQCPNIVPVAGCPPDPTPLIVTIAGSPTVDVTQIDLASLLLWKAECAAGGIAPISSAFLDETRPVDDPASCPDRSPDGILDLQLQFDRAQVIAALQLDQTPVGLEILVTLSGDFLGACPFVAYDFVTVGSCAPQ